MEDVGSRSIFQLCNGKRNLISHIMITTLRHKNQNVPGHRHQNPRSNRGVSQIDDTREMTRLGINVLGRSEVDGWQHFTRNWSIIFTSTFSIFNFILFLTHHQDFCFVIFRVCFFFISAQFILTTFCLKVSHNNIIILFFNHFRVLKMKSKNSSTSYSLISHCPSYFPNT